MEINETEDSTENVLSRMENSLNALEQMSLDSINITDKLVNGISDLQKCIEELRESPQQDKELIYEMIVELLRELLDTVFTVNNVSHELETEMVLQRDMVDNVRQIMDYLYGMQKKFEDPDCFLE